jgi:hypothetical protein
VQRMPCRRLRRGDHPPGSRVSPTLSCYGGSSRPPMLGELPRVLRRWWWLPGVGTLIAAITLGATAGVGQPLEFPPALGGEEGHRPAYFPGSW